ncbi:MAG: MFS transporter [Gammaproteobacteria bacterium]|nr:MFS transporter [Gammaproteobacteria bacterium]
MATSAHRAGLAKSGARDINRAAIVDASFVRFLAEWNEPVRRRTDLSAALQAGSTMTGRTLLDLFEAQMISRHLDLVAREMRARNEGFYTIGSAGHEGNALVGHLTRITDPAFLHYRSGAFMVARARRHGGTDPVYDTALSLSASRDDPVSGGRHKVWGSVPLWVLPQTSTIASHLPKAVGTAIALEQAKRLGRDVPVPADSIVVCSFGDASVNHSAALGAFNAAQWTAFQSLPVPILFVCEDNGIGISVKTPRGWIEASFGDRAGLHYVLADGLDLARGYETVNSAIEFCRRRRRPVFLHMTMVRLLGHAGTDVEGDYLSEAAIEANEARDPLLLSAESVLEAGLLNAPEILERYEALRDEVRDAAVRAAARPKLVAAEEVMRPLAPYRAREVVREATRPALDGAREAAFGEAGLPENGPPRHLSLQINRALVDLLAKYPEMTVFGEDVAQKGGVYTVTAGLAKTFKGNRVFNTLLDETTILGMAQGAGYMGLLPFPEIQYLAYFHNACDQIRGEAASLQFFSNGQFRNPMVVRIASLGYQKGFGGHFHNDNSTTALRDIPGLVIACPSRGDDAAMMLRTCAALAKVDGRVIVFLEPIALYMTKDLHAPRDNEWLFDYPAPDRAVPVGEGRIYHDGAEDLLIVSYGNGVLMALRAAKALKDQTGAHARVLDLRWLKPLNAGLIAHHADETGKVLVVDEGRRTGGIAEEIFAAIDEHARPGIAKRRVTGADSYIPLAAAANLVLPGDADVLAAARELLQIV